MSELFNIDEVSLQCFTNKHVYKKYLAKKNPANATIPSAHTETRKNAAFKKEALMDLFTQLLNNTCSDRYNILDSKYFPFIEACMDYLEKNERREIANHDHEKCVLPVVNEEVDSPIE